MRSLRLTFCRSISGGYSCFLRVVVYAGSLLLLLAGPAEAALATVNGELEEIVVTASLRPEPITRIPAGTVSRAIETAARFNASTSSARP